MSKVTMIISSMSVWRHTPRTFLLFLSLVHCLPCCEVTGFPSTHFHWHENGIVFLLHKRTLSISQNPIKAKCWCRWWCTAVKNHCQDSHVCYCNLAVGSCFTAGWLTKGGSVGGSMFNEAVLGEAKNQSLFSIIKAIKHLHKQPEYEYKSIYRFLIRC